MRSVSFFTENARWLAAGFLLTLASSFGQTFFIALYAEPLREAFDLSHGAFGALYMAATLASAAALIQAGRLADTARPRLLGPAIALGFAATALAMSMVSSALMLGLVLFGLRFLGQGMISHLGQVLTARWFAANRGRALAVASFGYPTGEALAPLAAVALIAALGWRDSWLAVAAVLALVVAPLLFWLLSRERAPRGREAEAEPTFGRGGRMWTRGEVVRDGLFWALLPGIVAPGYLLTVLFFLPGHIAETKGWPEAAGPVRYWVFALTAVAASFAAGWAIDRYSARRLLPIYLSPIALALLTLAYGSHVETYTLTLALAGVAAGATAPMHSAIWVELYGAAHLGSIKALALAVMVVSTAAGPGLVGAVIDAGASFPAQAPFYAAYVAAVCAWFWRLAAASRPM